MKNEFQYRLMKSMEKAQITAAELANRTGISEASISNYINGKYVAKQDRCYAIAKVLGVDPGWLMIGGPSSEEIIAELERFAESEDEAPQTKEAKIISAGIDKMSPERREQALKVLQTIFADIFDGGEK